jgi:hypothetical protein
VALYTQAGVIARQYFDDSGNPLSGGLLYSLMAGGSWPVDAVATYQTATGTLHTNPIVLDSAGRIAGSSELFLQPGQSYKFILRTSAGVLVWTKDGIGAVPPSTVNVDIQGIAGVALAAEDVVYLSTGSGGLNAGQWYKTDADLGYASSDAVTVGMIPTAIAAGGTGTIRIEGEMTVTGPLVAGASYWASAAAGALTATEPTMSRFVGQAQSAVSIVITPNRGGSGGVGGGGMDYLQLAVFA